MVDGVKCSLSTAERLARLLQLRTRWRHLDWTKVMPIPTIASCYAYELAGGAYATISPTVAGSGLEVPRTFALTWLPTISEGARSVKREDVGFEALDFAIDPSQDLVAFSQIVRGDTARYTPIIFGLIHVLTSRSRSMVIHLRTISDNRPHPKAKGDLQTSIVNAPRVATPHIVDDVVGMFVYTSIYPRLLIWHWPSGARLVVSTSAISLRPLPSSAGTTTATIGVSSGTASSRVWTLAATG